MKKTVYARVEEGLYNKLQDYSKTSAMTVSASLEQLVERGLSAIETGNQLEALAKEASALKDEVQKLREERTDISSKLQICQKNESLAIAARHQAESIKTQFEQILGIGVAVCGRAGCGQTWRLYDVWRHQCPKCGNSTAKLVTDYTPAGDNVRDILAVVGGATALVALLKAIGGNDSVA
jgi:hypothetical protein